MSYGINRVPRDVDPTAETLADLEAVEIMARAIKPLQRPPRKQMTCRHCRQSGYVGEYPFSTAPATGLCDDCL